MADREPAEEDGECVPEIQRPLALRLIAAAMMVPVPKGFVKMMACPACIPPLLIKAPSLAVPVTLNPACHAEHDQQLMHDGTFQIWDISSLACTLAK